MGAHGHVPWAMARWPGPTTCWANTSPKRTPRKKHIVLVLYRKQKTCAPTIRVEPRHHCTEMAVMRPSREGHGSPKNTLFMPLPPGRWRWQRRRRWRRRRTNFLTPPAPHPITLSDDISRSGDLSLRHGASRGQL